MYLAYKFPEDICYCKGRYFTWIKHPDKYQIGQTHEVPPSYKTSRHYLIGFGYTKVSKQQVENFLLEVL